MGEAAPPGDGEPAQSHDQEILEQGVEIFAEGGLEPEESAATLAIGPKSSVRWGTVVKALAPGTATWTVRTSWTEDGTAKTFDQDKGKSAICTSLTTKKKEALPPKLFYLTALQKEANRIFGYFPKRFMSLRCTKKHISSSPFQKFIEL